MTTPDQDTLIRAVEDARRILGEYIEPGPRDAKRTVERLLAVLAKPEIVHALDRMKRRRASRSDKRELKGTWSRRPPQLAASCISVRTTVSGPRYVKYG